jgi:hypothetical protein
MPASDRSTSMLAVFLVAVLTAATIAVSLFVVTSMPSGAVAGIAATPEPTASPPMALESSVPTASDAVPSPSGAGDPSAPPSLAPSASPLASPTPKPVLAMNLYRNGDFVSEATPKQCVSAAMQIMLNVIGPRNDRSAKTQTTLARLAKSLSDAPYGGTEPLGWARGLEKRGAGGYEVIVEKTLDRAVRRGVAAIRATGRPVGLLVWRGAHSWVLHGFETTADPAGDRAWNVTHIFVSDPWYPRLSRIWGRSRGPNARITPKQLVEDYLPWKRPTGRYPGMDGRFVLVIPVDR